MRPSLPPRKPPATMADVASLAGVSLKSVSRVINNEPHVSLKLTAQINAAIKQLDYVPDLAARSLAGARSFTIGVLFDNPSPHYTLKIQAGAYRACSEQKHHLRVDHINSALPADDLADQLAALLRHGRVDGFVLTPPLSDNLVVLDFLEASRVRYSRISPIIDPERSPSVLIDDEAAGAQVAELFWNNGHRSFGIINGRRFHGAAMTRRHGFIERLRAWDPAITIAEAYGDFTFEGGLSAGRELMSLSQFPTAIFATNDDSAAGALVACQQLGFIVPNDVSICGFDDSWIAKSVWPYLTTINQPIEEMAHAAAMLILDRSVDTDEKLQLRLKFELVERTSVASRLTGD